MCSNRAPILGGLSEVPKGSMEGLEGLRRLKGFNRFQKSVREKFMKHVCMGLGSLYLISNTGRDHKL